MLAAEAYRTLYMRAPVPMVTVRSDGQVIDANPVFCSTLRSTPEAVVGSSLVDLLAAQDRGACRVYLRQAFDRGEAEWGMSLASAPNQRWLVRAASFAGQIAVLMLWNPPGGEAPATLVPALAALARRTPGQAVFLLSPDLWIVGAWGLSEIGGEDDVDMVGQRLTEVLDLHSAVLRGLVGAVSEGEPWSGVLDPESSGPEATLVGHFLPAAVVGDHRHGAGFLVVREQTGTRATPPDRQRLQRLARVGDFTVHLLEDVRDRIQALLMADPASPEAERHRIELDALQHRLRQFVGVARATTEVADHNVAEALSRRWGTFMKEERIGFEVVDSLDGVVPTLAVAGEVVGTVLDELVDNARMAVKDLPDPAIRVEIVRSESTLDIVIDDSGPGVPPSRRESVFRPFVSGWPGRLGLGLSIARAHLDRVGGAVRLEDGAGSTRFIASVPIHSDDRPLADVAGGLRAPGLEGRSVLLVDESEASRRVLSRVLGTAGAEVREAWSVRSAVSDLLQRGPVDAVVCSLPGEKPPIDRTLADLREAVPGLDRRTALLVERGSVDPEVTERRFGCAVLLRPLMVRQLLDRLEERVRQAPVS